MGIIPVTMMGVCPGGIGDICDYFLRATWDSAGDQGYANAQVLDTVGEGVEDGSLTVVELDGTAECLTNRLKLSGLTTLRTQHLGVYNTTGYARTRGRTLLAKHEYSVTFPRSSFGWLANTTFTTNIALMQHSAGVWSTNALYVDSNVNNPFVLVSTFLVDTEYELAMVLGGYDSNDEPWDDNEGGTFEEGCALLIKGGTFTTWTLLWRFIGQSTTPLYPSGGIGRHGGSILYFDNFRVPDRDYSAVLQPTVKDTFTDGNGTSLDAHTLDVVPSGGWTEQAGNWDIQGNKANLSVSSGGGPQDNATVDAGVADVMIDGDCGYIVATNVGLVIRYSTTGPTFWALLAMPAAMRLYEYNGGFTLRASAAVATAAGNTYHLRAVAYGQTIDGYFEMGNKLTYGSAAMNETATIHGVHTISATNTIDNFAVYPRTSATYDAELDECPGDE